MAEGVPEVVDDAFDYLVPHPSSDPQTQRDITLAQNGVTAFAQGFFEGAGSALSSIDEQRVLEIANTADFDGPGVLLGIGWGLTEQLQDFGDTVWTIYQFLRNGLPPELRTAIQAVVARLNRRDIVGLARDAGLSLGASMGGEFANDISLLYRHVPDNPRMRELWPQIVLGRMLAPLVQMAIDIVVGALTSLAVASLSRRALTLVHRLADAIKLTDGDAVKRLSRIVRRSAPHPAPNRPDLPDVSSHGHGLPEQRGIDRTATGRPNDRRRRRSGERTTRPVRRPARIREQPSSRPQTSNQPRRRQRTPRRRRRVRVPRPQRQDPQLQGALPYEGLTMRTANAGERLLNDAPRITQIGAVVLPDQDRAVVVQIKGIPGASMRTQGRSAPRYNRTGGLRAPSAIYRTADDRASNIPLLGINEYHRAHLWGPGWGDEALDGIMYAPKDLNVRWQTLWRGLFDEPHGIERTIDDIAQYAADNGGHLEVIAVARSFGRREMRGLRGRELLLKEVSYDIRINIPGRTDGPERITEVSIAVDPPRRVDGEYVPGAVHRPKVERGPAWGRFFSDVSSNWPGE